MDWQDYIVWAIVTVVLAIVVKRILNLFKKDRKGSCSCCSGNCCCSKEHKSPKPKD